MPELTAQDIHEAVTQACKEKGIGTFSLHLFSWDFSTATERAAYVRMAQLLNEKIEHQLAVSLPERIEG